MPLTANGYDAKRAADWLDEIRNSYETETGLTVDWTRDEFLAQITALMAVQLGELSEAAQSLYDTFDVDNATGVYLDVLCALNGITRQSATSSTVEVELTGDDGTTIPAGSQIEDPQDRIWELNSSVTIPVSGASKGTVTGVFSAFEKGSLNLQSNAIDTANDSGRIVTPVSGWDSVQNTSAATPGLDEETDSELRARREESLQVVGAASVNAIRATLEDRVTGLQSAIVLDNPTDSSTTLPNTSTFIDPHAVSPVIWPSTSSEVSQSEYEDQIGEALAESVAAGIKPDGSESNTVTLGDGHTKDFGWTWANSYAINVDVVVSMKPGETLTGDLEAEIQDVVTEYFDGLSVGDDVRRLPVLGELSQINRLDSAEVRYAIAPQTPADQDVSTNEITIAQLNGTPNVSV